jgi:hypothetical protein
MNWRQFEWVSFGCYAMLIDWGETGILDYLRPLLRKITTCSDWLGDKSQLHY